MTLFFICLGVLMVVLDTTIVTVAMPFMSADLHLTESSLSWTLNAYMLTYGGFLILGGRLGDLYGRSSLFLIGVGIFTVTSLSCGLAPNAELFLLSRACQGLGAAVVTAVASPVAMSLFSDSHQRSRAVGMLGLVAGVGSALGETLGALLVQMFTWHSIFLLNVPVGIVTVVFCRNRLPRDQPSAGGIRQLDLGGAVLLTTACMFGLYSIVNSGSADSVSVLLVRLGILLVLLISFVVLEVRTSDPLLPLKLFRVTDFLVASIVGALSAAGLFAWCVITALYLQRTLGYAPIRVGLAFAPADVVMAALSAGLAARLVTRFGPRGPLAVGLLLAAVGLALLGRVPLHGLFIRDVLPGMILLGMGTGVTSTAWFVAAMANVPTEDSGLGSGVANTAFVMGGAVGLVSVMRIADFHAHVMQYAGIEPIQALLSGYRWAFVAGASITFAAALLAVVAIRASEPNIEQSLEQV